MIDRLRALEEAAILRPPWHHHIHDAFGDNFAESVYWNGSQDAEVVPRIILARADPAPAALLAEVRTALPAMLTALEAARHEQAMRDGDSHRTMTAHDHRVCVQDARARLRTALAALGEPKP